MPLIKVQTTARPEPPETEALLKQLSVSLARHTGKPEAYVMTALEPGTAMTFAGTIDPVCYVEVKSVGNMKPEQTEAMSQEFCQQINAAIAVPIDRIYIEFSDAKGFMWGWNGSTLG
ncbi:MAG TPA: phenylpyruvate tautomerase MIF-related protein [Thermosynechococcaceae cyanobacterium]|jgi:phenylpyruvate tautomerase PptA (4-oxalocrotonate tautomerase family)